MCPYAETAWAAYVNKAYGSIGHEYTQLGRKSDIHDRQKGTRGGNDTVCILDTHGAALGGDCRYGNWKKCTPAQREFGKRFWKRWWMI